MRLSAFQQYLEAIRRFKRLTPEEEQELARRRNRDAGAAHKLVSANLRFVVKIAFEYRSCGVEMSDLIQEGNIGLMKAVQRFDPDKGIRLISYAAWWIRPAILKHILESFSLVRLGTTQAQRKLFFSLARTRRELERQRRSHESGDASTENSREIARRLKVKPSEVQEMALRMERDLSLDSPVSTSRDLTRLDGLSCDRPSQDEELSIAREHSLVQRHTTEALGKLDRRERSVIEMRVMADEPSTLREMGHHFGLSSERARQLENRAKRKLRRSLQALAREMEWHARGRCVAWDRACRGWGTGNQLESRVGAGAERCSGSAP